jgi:hypothetical protein
MSEDRLAALEQRLAALEREVAVLRSLVGPAPWEPFVSTDPNDPLKGHPLISKKPPPEIAAALEAQRLKELGIDHIQPIGAEKLRQMLIDAGWDPTSNEASQEIIAAREDEG